MARPMHYLVPVPLLLSVALVPPAYAALPDAAKVMITNAAREGDAAELVAVTKLARRSFPEDNAEIDALLIALDNKGEGDAASVSAATPQPATPEPVKAAIVATPAPNPVKWTGRGDLGGFRTSGNSNSFGLSVGGSIIRKSDSTTHQIRVRGDYQENAGHKSREFINAAYQGDWKISKDNYALGILEYERDVLAGVDHRMTSSLGLGWKAIDGQGVTLSLEAGPAFRRSWFVNGTKDSNLAGRGAITSAWQINDKVRLSQNMELVTQTSNNTWWSNTGLQAKLTGRISSQISYDVRYQDQPQSGRETTDTVTRVGFVYDF